MNDVITYVVGEGKGKQVELRVATRVPTAI
jgi:hypothetical protein